MPREQKETGEVTPATTLVFIWIVSALLGAVVGQAKGKAAQGFALGLLLGVIGVLVAALLSKTPEKQAADLAMMRAALGVQVSPAGPSGHLPGPVNRYQQAPSVSRRSVQETNGALVAIRTAAHADADSEVLLRAIDQYAETRRPQRVPPEWFFATGPFPFVVRLDGQLLACNATEVRVVRADATANYTVSSDGEVVHASIDGLPFQSLRPRMNSIRILDILRAVPVDAPPPESPAPSNPQSLPSSATKPAGVAPSEAIRTLQALLEESLISPSEYERKRQEIIDRI